jgi:hypothetical protein
VGPILYELLDPVTEEEVLTTIRKTKNGAAGPDHISVGQVKSIPTPVLTAHYNLWLLLGSQPTGFRKGVTVLIPKSNKASDPSEYRPITMGPVVGRVFHKLLAARMEQLLPISDRQKAFRKGDGLAQNAWMIQSILKDHTTARKALNLTFIDIRKAFDSVSHESIILAARRMGVPRRLEDYIKDLYTDTSTYLRFDGSVSQSITCGQGVRQGDPLSPILFNCVMDWALASLNDNIGAKLGGTVVSYLAFADDIVLFSTTDSGMRAQLASLNAAFQCMGLSVNEIKSSSLRIQVDGKAKKWYVNPHPYLDIGERLIPAMAITGVYKYLGTGISAEGAKNTAKDKLIAALTEMTKAPLKPQQRMSILRDFLIPSLYHQLVFAGSSGQYLKRMDRLIWQKIRSWLGLPKDTPTSFFTCDVKEGGLGVFSLQTRVPLMRRTRVEALQVSSDPVVQAMLRNSESFKVFRDRCSKPTLMKGHTLTSEADVKRFHASELHNSADGYGLAQHHLTNVNNWVRSGTRLLSGRGYRNAIQLRAGTLHTPLRSCRGVQGGNAYCEACPRRICSLGHVLQVCERTATARNDRHDNIVKYVAKEASKRGFVALCERAVSTPTGNLRPDLIIYKSDRALVVDVTVVADNGSLSQAHADKVTHYNTAAVRDYVARLTSVPANKVEFSSVTLNWRGALGRESSGMLTSLGIGSREQEIISVKAVTGGFSTYCSYRRTTWRPARSARR